MQARVVHPVSGAVLYAYPLNEDVYPLSLYATHRVLLVETDNLYEGTIDLNKSNEWVVFEGASVPADYDDALYDEIYSTTGGNSGSGNLPSLSAPASTSEIFLLYNENKVVVVTSPSDFTAVPIKFVVENADKVNIYELADGSITKTSISFAVLITPTVTANTKQYIFSFRRVSNDEVIVRGTIYVTYAAF